MMKYTEAYFATQFYFELTLLLIGIGIFALLGVINLFWWLGYRRKEKYLIKLGFEHFLVRVASVGNHADYGWKRTRKDGTYEYITENELDGITFKKLKEKYKE